MKVARFGNLGGLFGMAFPQSILAKNNDRFQVVNYGGR